MRRISVEESGQITRFRLEGKMKGDWVRELERCWIHVRKEHPKIQFLIELSQVDYVDDDGRQLLSRMVSERTMLEAHNNLMSASLVDEIMHSPTHLENDFRR